MRLLPFSPPPLPPAVLLKKSLRSDKDECRAAEAGGSLLHPSLSSVLYLGTAGGPTAVLPQSAVRDEQAPQGLGMASWAPGEMDVVSPCPGSFLAFQGHLLHGVVPQPEREGEGRRLTLLINWWQRTPHAPCCSPLPPELLTALTASEPQTPPDEWGLGDGSVPERCEPEALREVDAMDVECEELEILAPPHLGETLLRLPCACCALARSQPVLLTNRHS